VHELGHEDGLDFLVMELIPGKSLHAILKEGPLAEKVLPRLGVQLLEGLCAALQQGVIHRDLKPANLFVTPEGRAKRRRAESRRTRHARDQRASAPFRDGRNSRRPIERSDLVGEIAGWATVRASEIETRRKCSSDLRRRLFAGFDGYDSSLSVRTDLAESRFLY
jgi:serine/threonine protein kinase